MMSSIFQKQLNVQFSNYIGDGICSLHSMLAAIKDKCNAHSSPDVNISFTIQHKDNVRNLIDQEYGHNTATNLLHIYNNSNTTLIDASEQSITNQEILSQDSRYSYNTIPQNDVTQYDEEISYETAYHLLLNLVNNDVNLFEEVISIAEVLVREGVLVAPESKIKKNIAQIILHNIQHKQKTQHSGYSR